MHDPASDRTASRRAPSLTVIGGIGAVLLLAWLLAWVVIVLQTKGRELALEEAWKRAESAGQAGTAEIGARAIEVATLARTIAETIEHVPLDERWVLSSLPKLLDFQGDLAIAGGGYWPEPFAFDATREKRSFFWGRSSSGALEYFNDYNVSEAGYHGEEWYMSARDLPRGRVHWSRTYLDAFTRQPMVTCTAPVFRSGKFHGAITIDLRLEGLGDLAAAVASRTGGYAFVLDPQGRFITFPDPRLVVRKDGERMTLEELAKQNRAFAPLVEIGKARPAGAKAGYVQRIALSDPPLLHEPAMAFGFEVPQTQWRLVVVKPVSEGTRVASELIRILTLYLALGLTGALAIAWLIADRGLIRPLRRTTQGVQHAGQLLAEGRFGELRGLRVAGGGAREIEVLTEVLNALAAAVGRVTGDLDRARTAAESASRAKSEFLAAMSHELRTPLNQILGYTEILEEEAQDAGRESEVSDLRRVHGSASGLLRMVDDALAISQMEGDKLALARSRFDAWPLAREVVGSLRPLAEKNGNTLSLECPESPAPVDTDADKLRVCLRHLVDNACGFTHDGKVLVSGSIEPDGAGEMLVFRVSDTGPGIPEDKRQMIFERFTQVDRSSTRTRDGAGLGLAVTKGFAEALGGGVEVAAAEGGGSVFTLRVRASLPS